MRLFLILSMLMLQSSQLCWCLMPSHARECRYCSLCHVSEVSTAKVVVVRHFSHAKCKVMVYSSYLIPLFFVLYLELGNLEPESMVGMDVNVVSVRYYPMSCISKVV